MLRRQHASTCETGKRATIRFPCHAGFVQQWNFDGLNIYGIGSTHTSCKRLDVSGAGTADGTVVQLYDCNGSGAQQWYFINSQIINTKSGKCLDVGNAAPSTQATIKTCNGSVGQRWVIR